MSDSDTSTIIQRFSKKLIATSELIELVRQKRCLWDRGHPAYRDKAAKDKCWHEIYVQLEPAFDTLNARKKKIIGNMVTRKWYNVRDSYVKSRKPGVRRPYLYSEQLQFLDPIYLGDRKHDKSYIEDEEADNDNSHNWLTDVFVDVEEGREHEASSPKRPKINFGATKDDNEESIVSVLANLIQKEEDEDRAFFKSITPSVKTLSESAKFEFRIQVMKLINSLKFRDRKVLNYPVNLKQERTSNVESDSE